MNYSELVLPRLRYQYCPMCRAALTQILSEDAIERAVCPSCKWIHYPSSAIGVVVLITHPQGIVALLPPQAPEGYPAALPGGHAEYGESPAEAAVREAYEETGLKIEITELLGWQFNKNIGYPGPMLHFYYEAKAIGGALRGSEEGQAAVFPPEDFPPIAPARGGSRKTLELFLAKHRLSASG